MIIEPATRWKRKRGGQTVVIVSVDGMHSVSYKALDYQGGHAATATKRRAIFEREFVPVIAEEPPTILLPSADVYVPAAAIAGDDSATVATVAKVRSWFDVVAARLVAKASAHDSGVVSAALREVADAFFQSVMGEVPMTRESVLVMSVAGLCSFLRLASVDQAKRAILNGEVFVDGELVVDPETLITTVKRERFAVRCGEGVAVVKVVG